ncbi:methylaspartate mutase [Dactylosporangium fulvum]|uniref:Methylaspartate mutase n=1 Tax=Dactylosporangium fulvum TaxID=53359 RepID=A0ABY5VQ44_9ACTN|nr:methylaspartate mutase [Dactylosporangium fulvum]UWP79893.1 methylaspartate mutase [Dactylosporangium fulvum]
MPDLLEMLELSAEVVTGLPDSAEITARLATHPGRRPVDALRAADLSGRPFVQPRCGVGGHEQMVDLLRGLARTGPGMLSVTIDSYTRLRQFTAAARVLREQPADLNGYPLVAHGWHRARELVDAVDVPLEVRHGSPDARELFAVSVAAGISSFEGGGISYNLPYSKAVPLADSLAAWRRVDAACGRLARDGVLVDRELFGTLTAVLMPPSISLAVALLEARLAIEEGVGCVSIAYPQGGEAHQDIAALRSIRSLGQRYLPAGVEVYPVLHEFMGVFPRRQPEADALILYGGLVARLGRATKVVCKTNQEAYGIPDAAASAHGVRTAALGTSGLLDFVRLDEDRIAEEQHWLEREVAEIVDPVLDRPDLAAGIVDAFAKGQLDVPFSASVHARSAVVPQRDGTGAIRYRDVGHLPLSAATRRHHTRRLAGVRSRPLIDVISADVNYFSDAHAWLASVSADE